MYSIYKSDWLMVFYSKCLTDFFFTHGIGGKEDIFIGKAPIGKIEVMLCSLGITSLNIES